MRAEMRLRYQGHHIVIVIAQQFSHWFNKQQSLLVISIWFDSTCIYVVVECLWV